MTYSKPNQILVDEHEVISSVLDAVETVARQQSDTFPQEFFEKAFDFFPTFADKCHHAKEETHLFPLLKERGIPQEGGPIGCMLSDHEQGRAHVAAVCKALRLSGQGDQQAREVVRSEALAYVTLLRQHIDKENHVLFPAGDQNMTTEDKADLWQKFQCAEHEVLPPGTHEKYVALAKELCGMARLDERE